jgi:hypothetical protein
MAYTTDTFARRYSEVIERKTKKNEQNIGIWQQLGNIS